MTRTVSGVSGISLLHDVKKTAAWTAAEPYSSTLDVDPAATRSAVWWSQTGSNRRPPACKAGALPTELWPRLDLGPSRPPSRLRSQLKIQPPGMVGLERFELSTSRLSSARSNQLSYRPGKRGGRPNEERETKAAVSRRHFAEPIRFLNRSDFLMRNHEVQARVPEPYRGSSLERR